MRPSHVEAAIPSQQQPYFHHGQSPPRQPPRLRPQTRYLCGAGYLDEHFADQVLGEVIENEHRAVAPSYDVDLDPVVRHCFRARRLWLVHNALLTAVLVVAWGLLLWPAASWAAALALLLGGLGWSRYRMLRVLTTELAPGSAHPPPGPPSARTARRLTTVATAQNGNVLLHDGYEPFLGAGGRVLRSWSIVVDLTRYNGQPDMMGPADGPVDPVELNRHVKRRLAALRAEVLPERQQISGLTLRDQIVAAGTQWQGYPLVDPIARLPYAYASPRAIEAIMRHPRTSARHFLRATLSTGGKTVVADDDQQVLVSAFVHTAVEGGMLYVEFAATVLGPLRAEYHTIDMLPTNTGDLVGHAVADVLRRLPLATLSAPVRLVRAGLRSAARTMRMNAADRCSQEAPAYRYGARLSVRELASQREPDTLTRRLDAEKYTKIIERRVTDAVLDYLEEQHVDISGYRAQMSAPGIPA